MLQNCDLAQQSIVHVVQSPQKNSQNKDETEDYHAGGVLKALERQPESLTRVDLGTSILPSLSAGLAVILDTTNPGISHSSEKSGKSGIWYIVIHRSEHLSVIFLRMNSSLPQEKQTNKQNQTNTKCMVYFSY